VVKPLHQPGGNYSPQQCAKNSNQLTLVYFEILCIAARFRLLIGISVTASTGGQYGP